MAYTDYVPIAGTLFNITQADDCCSQFISLRTGNGIVNFIIEPETLVIDNRLLRPGLNLVAFYDKTLPIPMIFPPQYRAKIAAVHGTDQQVMLNFFDRRLLSADKSLQLNLSVDTHITTTNGQLFTCNPGNQVLLVYYTNTTRSNPPQTTPSRIVVMC